MTNLTTNVKVDPQYAQLDDNPPALAYLTILCIFANYFPKIVSSSISGKTMHLKQVVLSGTNMTTEKHFYYLWPYKSEVTFNMPFSGNPLPVLTHNSIDPNRRHSHNPFGFVNMAWTTSKRRRPDMIIVKNSKIRWPGREYVPGSTTPLGYPNAYPDNLYRVVEIKFAGDDFNEGQKEDYVKIAGTKENFTVINVGKEDQGKRKQAEEFLKQQLALHPWIFFPPVDSRKPPGKGVPVFSLEPIKDAWVLQEWINSPNNFSILGSDYRYPANNLTEYYAPEVAKFLKDNAPWLASNGEFSISRDNKNLQWQAAKNPKTSKWSHADLQAAWRYMQEKIDISVEMLANVEWGQVLMTAGKALAITLVIAGMVVLLPLEGIAAGAMAAVVALLSLARAVGTGVTLFLALLSISEMATAKQQAEQSFYIDCDGSKKYQPKSDDIQLAPICIKAEDKK